MDLADGGGGIREVMQDAVRVDEVRGGACDRQGRGVALHDHPLQAEQVKAPACCPHRHLTLVDADVAGATLQEAGPVDADAAANVDDQLSGVVVEASDRLQVGFAAVAAGPDRFVPLPG